MSLEKMAIRIILLLGVVLGVTEFGAPCRSIQAEEPWGFSPYRVRAWIQYADHPSLNPALSARVAYDVPAYAELLDKSGWRIAVEPAPKEYSHWIARDVEDKHGFDSVS